LARDHRRLAAIVSADVVGYSLLMGRDEGATLAGLKAHRQELIDPKIAEYGGRIVKTTGDGLLLEFPSVVDAVRCAVDFQRGMAERNAPVPAEQRIEFRIGINVGDIIIDGDDIFGDGVNVAARLQTLADPGGICVSRVVRDQVLDKLSFAFEDLGPREVKNIARPVEVYRVDLAHAALRGPDRRHPARRPWRALAVGVAALGLGGIAAWGLIERGKAPTVPAPPAMSVGVLPLLAPPGDGALAEQAQAWTGDLTSMLGVTGTGIVAVPAPPGATRPEGGGSSAEMARKLNVRYLLEGQVRNGPDATRVSLRLVNGATGEQVGSETAVLKTTDTPSDQSQAVRKAVNRLVDALSSTEMRRALALPLDAATPMDYVLRARALDLTEADTLQRAREKTKLCEAALQQDPNFVPALNGLALALFNELWDDIHADRQGLIRRLDEVTSKAVNLDGGHAAPWSLRALVLVYMGQWDAAMEASSRAMQLDAQSSDAVSGRAWLMNNLGRPQEALARSEQAIALNPPGDYFALFNVCEAQLLLGQFKAAIAACERAKGLSAEDIWADVNLAAAYANLGETDKAEAAKAEVRRRQPELTIAAIRNGDSLHPDYVRLANQYYYSGLRKAGFPEQ
jgi:class 3 adenylate cyclase/tetratricopeptide (TPR) repeat protein